MLYSHPFRAAVTCCITSAAMAVAGGAVAYLSYWVGVAFSQISGMPGPDSFAGLVGYEAIATFTGMVAAGCASFFFTVLVFRGDSRR